MKKRFALILLLLLSLLSLTACSSQEDTDTLVKEYVEDKYGFSVEIQSREESKEGNSGDKTYVVIQSAEPNIQFEVTVAGGLISKIAGDTYFANKKAIEHSQKFTEEYKKDLKKYDYNEVTFTTSSSSQNGFNIQVVINKDITLNNQESLYHLLGFISIINQFDKEILNKENIDDLSITSKTDHDLKINLHDLHNIIEMKDLTKQLKKDSYVVNKSLFEKNKPAFIAIENELKKIGFEFTNGVNLGSLTGSFLCMEQNLKDGECVGGYEVNIEGPKDAEKVLALVQLLNSQTIKFKNVFINGDEPVKIDNIGKITTIEQVKEAL